MKYLLLIFLSGCSAAKTDSLRADLIPGPAGYTCFAIIDYQGRAIGGNCVRE